MSQEVTFYCGSCGCVSPKVATSTTTAASMGCHCGNWANFQSWRPSLPLLTAACAKERKS